MHRNRRGQAAARTTGEVCYKYFSSTGGDSSVLKLDTDAADTGHWMLYGTFALSAYGNSGLLSPCPATESVDSLQSLTSVTNFQFSVWSKVCLLGELRSSAVL